MIPVKTIVKRPLCRGLPTLIVRACLLSAGAKAPAQQPSAQQPPAQQPQPSAPVPSIEELKRQLDSGEPVVIIDLRSELDVAAVPVMIPRSLRIAPEELERRHQEIPRDRDIILYCS